MQKVSFFFPPEIVQELDNARGTLSRNKFVLSLLTHALEEHQERKLHRITAEVYGARSFADEEENLAEGFFHSCCSENMVELL